MSSLITPIVRDISSNQNSQSFTVTDLEGLRPSETDSISQDWKELLVNEILEIFSSCKEGNWDGEDACAVTEGSVSHAILLVQLLPQDILKPEISAGNDGDILFDWKGQFGELLTLACTASGNFYFAAQLSPRQNIRSSSHTGDPFPFVLKNLLVQRFLSN